LSSKAQLIRLSEKPETFITDIQTVMATDNNAVAIATGKKFETYWTSRFSNEQKTALIATCRKMGTRGHKMAQFYYFFTILDKAIEQEKFSDEKVSNLIDITNSFVDAYDIKTSTKMLEILKDFIEKRRLYASNFNRLYALGGSYELKFLDKKRIPTLPQQLQRHLKIQQQHKHQSNFRRKKYFDDWDTPTTAEPVITPAGGVSSQSLFESEKKQCQF